MRIAIYFPSKSEQRIPNTRFESVRKDVERELIEMFGGLTEYKAKGFWMDNEGKTINENVRILEAYTETLQHDKFISVIRKIRALLKQESVAYSVNGEMHFVSEAGEWEQLTIELFERRGNKTTHYPEEPEGPMFIGQDEGKHYVIKSTMQKVT